MARGYEGEELLERFKEEQRKVRPAAEAMLAEASRVATSETEYASYDDVFGKEE